MAKRPIILIPLDARPVCYDWVKGLAQMAGLSLEMPAAAVMGHLKQPADCQALLAWWRQTLSQYSPAAVILALDTPAYGGLIPSRLHALETREVETRVGEFLKLCSPEHRPRYGFSSIMRIPAYNGAEEEPDYWERYGKLMYELSVETHKRDGDLPQHLTSQIPGNYILDFMKRREKNFEVNQRYLSLVESRQLDYLVYAQDDTGPMGLNVMEANKLSKKIRASREKNKMHLQTGADELAGLLLAKAVWAMEAQPLKIYCRFFPEECKKTVAKFDGIPIGDVVQRQIKTLGAVSALRAEDADLILHVVGPAGPMGDLMAGSTGQTPLHMAVDLAAAMNADCDSRAVALVDVVSANGADNVLMQALQKINAPISKLAAYGAWNTPGNSIGSALAMGALTVWAKRNDMLDSALHKTLLATRLLDDWVYQGDVRQALRRTHPELASSEILQSAMASGVSTVCAWLGAESLRPRFSFPCSRYFEIKVAFD